MAKLERVRHTEEEATVSYQGDNMFKVKRSNRSAVLRLLREQDGLSRKRLAEQTRLTPAAITKITSELIAEGLVHEGRTLPSGSAGRREVCLEPDMRARCALGLLLNRGQALLSAVWLDGSVIFEEEQTLTTPAPAEQTLARLCARLLQLAKEQNLDPGRILGVGVAIRGITDSDGRSVRNSFGTLDERDYPLAARVEALTGLPVVMANNVRALFAAQMFLSSDPAHRSQFFLRCEYGIGGALAVNGQIWRGATEQCSELGHIPVVKQGGKLCVCGKRGCLETIASPTAIREDAEALLSPEGTPLLWKLHQEQGGGPLALDEVLTAAAQGDAAVAALVDRALSALADALKAVIYALDPGKLVLYGRLFDDPWLLERLREEMREGVDSEPRVSAEVSPFNHKLENKAAPLLMVEDFFLSGGLSRTL